MAGHSADERRLRAAIDAELGRRRRAVGSGSRFVLDTLRDLQADVRRALEGLPSDFGTAFLPELLRELDGLVDEWEARAKPVVGAVFSEAAAVGGALVTAPLAEIGIQLGGVLISRTLLEAVEEFTAGATTGIGDAARLAIREHVSLGILGGQSPHQVMLGIGEALGDGPMRHVSFRAETNMRTYTGQLHSVAAEKSFEAAAQTVPDLMGEWVWSGKKRAAHSAVHGQRRKLGQTFLVGGEEMLYPRQPGKSAANVINCGCEKVPWLARWAS